MESPAQSRALEFATAYAKAVLDRDVDAFMRLYDPHVRIFDTWGVWSYEGAGAWRKMAEGWFSSLGEERVRVTADDLRATGNDELIVASAFFTYAALDDEGMALRSMQNRITWTLQRVDDDWKIVHEHTSAPIGFDDGKAILRR